MQKSIKTTQIINCCDICDLEGLDVPSKYMCSICLKSVCERHMKHDKDLCYFLEGICFEKMIPYFCTNCFEKHNLQCILSDMHYYKNKIIELMNSLQGLQKNDS